MNPVDWLDSWLESHNVPFTGMQVYLFLSSQVFEMGLVLASVIGLISTTQVTIWALAAILTALAGQAWIEYRRNSIESAIGLARFALWLDSLVILVASLFV